MMAVAVGRGDSVQVDARHLARGHDPPRRARHPRHAEGAALALTALFVPNLALTGLCVPRSLSDWLICFKSGPDLLICSCFVISRVATILLVVRAILGMQKVIDYQLLRAVTTFY